MKKIKTVEDFNLKSKRVILRVDYNLPIDKGGEIKSFFRVKRTLETINFLLKNKAKVIIISHLGRPQEIENRKDIKRFSLKPISDFLRKELLKRVIFFPDCVGKKIESLTKKMKDGEVLLLENLRFHRGEEENDEDFARSLSKLGDIYISEAFSVAHRNHASIVLLPKFLPHGIGFSFKEEIENLSEVFKSKRPVTFVVGGVKVKTKLEFAQKVLKRIDYLLLGGKIGEEVLKSKTIVVGRPLPSEEVTNISRKIDLTDSKIYLPTDVVVSPDSQGSIYTRVTPLGEIRKEEDVFDIGPDTIEIYSKIIGESKTVVFIGPLGLFENDLFSKGTEEIIKAIGEVKEKAFTVAGGGETILFLEKADLFDKFDFVSSGGGAALAFLSGEKLPGIEVLEK